MAKVPSGASSGDQASKSRAASGASQPPPGRRSVITNALTVDLEDWYHGVELPPERWREFEDRVAPVTSRLLEILDERGVRATFFVLGDVAERQSDLVREIHSAG